MRSVPCVVSDSESEQPRSIGGLARGPESDPVLILSEVQMAHLESKTKGGTTSEVKARPHVLRVFVGDARETSGRSSG